MARRLRFKKPIALHLHNDRSQVSRDFIRNFCGSSDVVIACSRFVATAYERAGNLPRGSIEVACNGADPSLFSPRADEKTDAVLFVGSLRDYKGLHLLLDAMRSVARSCPKTELWIVAPGMGQSDELANLASVKNALNLDPNYVADLNRKIKELESAGLIVRRLGARTHEGGLPEAYARASLVCVPSLEEPFGMVAVEAMASGSAVVACNVGGLPEVVHETGLLVDPTVEALAEAITRVLASDSLRRSCETEGRKRVLETFTWDLVWTASEMCRHWRLISRPESEGSGFGVKAADWRIKRHHSHSSVRPELVTDHPYVGHRVPRDQGTPDGQYVVVSTFRSWKFKGSQPLVPVDSPYLSSRTTR
jgi:glycosyltransferase involved in cell wall biosynthesis